MYRYEHVHEPINIYFYTKNNKSYIRAFEWQNRIYKISRNNLITKALKGNKPVYLFSVSNDNGAYKLRFDTDSLAWWLEEIYWE